MAASFPPHRSRQGGFSLVELLVSVVIMAEIMVGVAILFDSSNRLARAQTHVAELQQSMRVGQSEVTRFVRAAGIGGLPITRLNPPAGAVAEPNSPNGAFPRSGYAVSVLNDHSGTIGPDQVLPGSDVLIVRGVFTTPLYYFSPPIDTTTWLAAGLPIEGKVVTIPDRARTVKKEWEDYPQDIVTLGNVLKEAKDANRAVAFILRDTLNPNAYAVLEFDVNSPEASFYNVDPALLPNCTVSVGADPAKCISFTLRLDVASEPGLSYGKLTTGTSLIAPQFPDAPEAMTLVLPAGSDFPPINTVSHVNLPTRIGSIGLLEEYRFFVRAEYEVPGDTDTRLTPVLSRASFLPGTTTRIDRVDIADNVIDLQIAVGIDTDLPGTAGYGEIAENTLASWAADEVLFNEAGDADSDDKYEPPPGAAANWYDPINLQYHFLRINTLVQSRFPDLDHRAPVLSIIEDHNRGASFSIGPKSYQYNSETQYHRRWLQTVVELRNLQ